jgi:stage IV sporulation protein FB
MGKRFPARETPVFIDHQPTSFDVTFRLWRFPVRVHPLFWLSMALIGLSWFDKDLLAGLLWVACGFVAILWHELGHALVIRRYGSPARIQLIAFGGLAIPTYPSPSPWRRLAIAAAGPAAGFLLLAIVWGSNQLAPWSEGHAYLALAYFFLVMVNLFWSLLNLLPIWPLDGGMILREALVIRRLRTPDYTTQRVSIAVALGLVALGLVARFFPPDVARRVFEHWPWWLAWAIPSPVLIVFLLMMAYQSYEMLKRLRRPRLYVD